MIEFSCMQRFVPIRDNQENSILVLDCSYGILLVFSLWFYAIFLDWTFLHINICTDKRYEKQNDIRYKWHCYYILTVFLEIKKVSLI